MSELAVSDVRRARYARPSADFSPKTQVIGAEILPGEEACRSLQNEWNALSERCGNVAPFQDPNLLAVWARHFRSDGEFLVVLVRDQSRPVLIWPIAIERRGPFRIAVGAGAPIVQYDELLLDPAVEGKAAFELAIQTLTTSTSVDAVTLERIREDGALWSVLGQCGAVVRGSEAAPYADLSAGVGPYTATLKKRVLTQQKRRVRRFQDRGPWSFQMAEGPDEAQAWVREALALKRKWLESTGRISRAFADPRTGQCLEKLARNDAGQSDLMRTIVFRLVLNERTAALEVCFRHRDSLHFYLGAHVPESAPLGPGNILTEQILSWCEANGVRRYDMMSPRSRFKSEWQSGEVRIGECLLPTSLRGRLYSLPIARIVPFSRSVFYRLPRPLRSTLARLVLKI